MIKLRERKMKKRIIGVCFERHKYIYSNEEYEVRIIPFPMVISSKFFFHKKKCLNKEKNKE
jgi:hypothetical protein